VSPSPAPPSRTPATTILGLEAVAETLERAGARAWLVGPALLRWRGDRSTAPITLWTTAPHAQLASLFPRAVPMPGGAWLIPTGRLPVFATPLAAADRGADAGTDDQAIDEALARMPFGVLAVGVDIASGACADPVGGGEDLEHGRLRLLGSVPEAVQRDPVLVLRAARLVAEHGLVPLGDWPDRLRDAAPSQPGVPPVHTTSMLRAILMSPHVEDAVTLLERAGLRTAWLGPTAPGAPGLRSQLSELPDDFALRLLAWCSPARPSAILRRLRLDVGTRERFVRLTEHHPIDVRHASPRPRTLRRLVERLGHGDVSHLIDLRRSELADSPDAGARAQIEAFASALATFDGPVPQTPSLAVGGHELMEALGLPAGPELGRLLARLETAAAAGRVANEPAALLAWARSELDASKR